LLNSALARVAVSGASIGMTLSGNLRMTSSQIASFNGGNITISSSGSISVGGQDSFASDSTPKGIYTAHGGNLSVHAAGDINVEDSRIATYDGGDITVISDSGNVDAGAGAKGFFSVTTSQIDPATGQPEIRNDRFFGSGIMALTRTDSGTRVGNIMVEAAGNILAGAGGILQLPFNGADQSGAKVSLSAGGSILASQSGILGRDVSLKAGGDIQGIIVAARNVVIDALGGVAVTALAGGSASVSSGSGVSGLIAGAGNVSVSGSEINASVISTGGSTSTSGNASGASVGAFASVAAPAAAKTVESGDKTVAPQTLAMAGDEEDQKKRTGKAPVLVHNVGRVTVILPQN
jgi:hypothetical protein